MLPFVHLLDGCALLTPLYRTEQSALGILQLRAPSAAAAVSDSSVDGHIIKRAFKGVLKIECHAHSFRGLSVAPMHMPTVLRPHQAEGAWRWRQRWAEAPAEERVAEERRLARKGIASEGS